MKEKNCKTKDRYFNSRGVGTVEIIIVLVLIALLAAFAIPQLLSSRRLIKFTNLQQQIVAELREARQFAISQRRKITVQYDDTDKIIRTFEEPVPTPVPLPSPAPTPLIVDILGPQNDARNRVVKLTDSGLSENDIIYGAPSTMPIGQMTLKDTSTFTCPSLQPPPPAPLVTPTTKVCPGEIISVTFNPRGDVVIPTTSVTDFNKALFFYENNSKNTFAISILAPGGRIKIWRYNGTTYE